MITVPRQHFTEWNEDILNIPFLIYNLRIWICKHVWSYTDSLSLWTMASSNKMKNDVDD